MPRDRTQKAANAVLQRLFSRIDIARRGRFPLCKPGGLCYTQPGAKHWFALFLGSSVVEQPAVNRLVAGSNPARGAKYFKYLDRTFGARAIARSAMKCLHCSIHFHDNRDVESFSRFGRLVQEKTKMQSLGGFTVLRFDFPSLFRSVTMEFFV
jgi:hypothetical protein